MKSSPKSGLSYWLSISLQALFGVVFVALFLSFYSFAEKQTIKSCDENASAQLEVINLKIDRELSRCEGALNMLSGSAFAHGIAIPRNEEAIFLILENFMRSMTHMNPSVTGVVVAFEDEIFPQYAHRNGFIPLVRLLSSGELHRYQVGEVRDVRNVNDWYSETRRLDRPRWSHVFLSEDGEPISCCCLPLHDATGRFVGAIAVDLSLHKLQDELQTVSTYPGAEVSLIDENFVYLVHPNSELIMNHTVMEELEQRGFEILPDVKADIEQHRPGKKHIQLAMPDGKGIHETFFYYSPVPKTQWTIQIDCPAESVYRDLAGLRVRMFITAMVGVLLLLTMTVSFLKFR